MKIGRQGKRVEKVNLGDEFGSEVQILGDDGKKIRARDSALSGSTLAEPEHQKHPRDTPTSKRFSTMTINTIHSMTSIGSAESWEPRWSLEANSDSPLISKHKDNALMYEVCTKCGEERRYIAPGPKKDPFTDENFVTDLGSDDGGGKWKVTDPRKQSHRHTWSGARGLKSMGTIAPAVMRKEDNGGWI